MKKTGSIAALIGGCLGVFISLVQFIGGMMMPGEESLTVFWFGIGGLIFTIPIVVLSCIALSATTTLRVGIILTIFAFLGCLGGPFVAVAMIPVLIGGIILIVYSNPAPVRLP